jgi:hypothetical protein
MRRWFAAALIVAAGIGAVLRVEIVSLAAAPDATVVTRSAPRWR